MSASSPTQHLAPEPDPPATTSPPIRSARRVPLVLVLVLAAGLNAWGIAESAWGNAYYAAAVRTMAGDVQSLLVGGLDQAGTLTVDKSPVFLWPQVVAVQLLGYHSWVVLLPQAVAGTLAVGLVYGAVRRWSGELAALLAAVVTATTPILVALHRTNNPDTLLLLALTAAGYALSRALTGDRPLAASRWTVLCGALLGAAFAVKSFQGAVVFPAFVAAYLLAGPGGRRRRITTCAAAGGALTVVAAGWLVVRDLWPGGLPYQGGSRDGSAFDLLIGYNGFYRLVGGRGGLPANPDVPPEMQGIVAEIGRSSTSPGSGRLFGPSVAEQIAWLLPLGLAVLAVVSVVALMQRAAAGSMSRSCAGGWVLWGGWMLSTAVVFSLARGPWHPYYTALLGPALAAVVGAGVVVLRELRGRPGTARFLPALLVAGSAVWAAALSARNPGIVPWLAPLVLLLGATATVALLGPPSGRGATARTRVGAVLAVAALLLAPTAWSVLTAVAGPANRGGTMPAAGPAPSGPSTGYFAVELDEEQRGILDLAFAAPGSTGDILGVESGVRGATAYMINSDRTVVPMGGFNGTDAAPDPEVLDGWLATGRLKYIVSTGPSDEWARILGGAVAERRAWIERRCDPIAPALYGGRPAPAPGSVNLEATTVYRCRP